jgi:hypothetical protein
LLSGGSTTTQLTKLSKIKKKLNVLLQELSDDEEMITDAGTSVPEDPELVLP